EIRKLSIARRRGPKAERQPIEDRLRAIVRSLTLHDAEVVTRAFAAYFELVNLAEQHHRIRRARAHAQDPDSPGWCAPCREEQPQLKAWYEKYKDRGLIIVEALFQNNEFQPASFADLQAWQNQYKLPFPVTLDPDFQLEPFFTTLPPSPP